jgi:CubicO group peptidase (beta-lactamase class C family)
MKRFAILLACLLCGASAFADKVDRYIKEQMTKGHVPGVAVAIVKNGKLVKATAYGYANLELKTRVDGDTEFEVGAITKQFTAAGIMMLVEEARLSLDDRIASHLKGAPALWDKITIRQLMNHTSGIKSFTDTTNKFRLTEHLTQKQFIEQIGSYPLEFKPGEQFKYGNTGYVLLGYIIENVTKTNYWGWMNKEIFQPLGMKASGDRDPARVMPKRVQGYARNNSGGLSNRDMDLTDLFASGAMVTTLTDLLKWDEALRDGLILSPRDRELMWTPTTLPDGSVKHYGLGWGVATSGRTNVGHSGYTSGFSTTFQKYPEDHLTIIILTNLGEESLASILADNLAKMYLK